MASDAQPVAASSLNCASLDVPAARARLWLAWNERGLTRLTWQAQEADARVAFGSEHPPLGELPEPYASTLRAYLDGAAVDPAGLPVQLDGTAFRCKVWAGLRAIPRGEVRSYAALAQSIGAPRALRAVGSANGHNPIAIVVPCHRVIEANMQLGGYTGGVRFKHFLLELEGARIVGERVHPGQLELGIGR